MTILMFMHWRKGSRCWQGFAPYIVASIYILDFIVLPLFNIILSFITYRKIVNRYGNNFTILYTAYFGLLNSFRLIEFFLIALPQLREMRDHLQAKQLYISKTTEELQIELK
jgi:hypothetical protein